jgi:glycerol-3-phosphate acyltransferase PlsX
MRVAFDLIKEGQADAVVSAGHSGAMMACGLFVLGRLEGVERPGIVAQFPTVSGECLLCDIGANVDPKPEVLAQFGLLGAVYARVLQPKKLPRVGLLSNGEEEHKGTELTRAAHEILKRLADGGDLMRYVGYVEGRDIFLSDLDVVATDGFTGNVLLKTAEGAGLAIMHLLKRAFTSSTRAKVGALLARPALLALRKKIDYAETGGAPLLGVDGTVMICHGGSSAVALKNALFAADRFVERGLKDAVADAIRRHSVSAL